MLELKIALPYRSFQLASRFEVAEALEEQLNNIESPEASAIKVQNKFYVY